MTVSKYVTRFTQLSRYNPTNMDTDEKKQECFMDGLDDGHACASEARDFKNFQTMLDKALVLKNGRGILSSKRKQGIKPNRAPTPGPASMSNLHLLDLSSTSSHRVLN
jgi:hypothetical protein